MRVFAAAQAELDAVIAATGAGLMLDAPHDFRAMAVFGLFGFQELATGRRIEIQILHIDGSAARS